MSSSTAQSENVAIRPSVSDVLDQAWLDEGMSLQELETNKRLADIFDQLLASGRTPENINAEWETKTPQEIICNHAPPFLTQG